MVNSNDIFRVEKNVTPSYVSGSRDFQMLCRLMTLVVGGCRNAGNQLKYLNDPININSNLLPLLQGKVGFLTENTYTDSQTRDVIEGFRKMVKCKGSKLSIEMAIELFFNALNMLGTKTVEIINGSTSGTTKSIYTIYINLSSNQKIDDTTLLFDLLSFVVPAGYNIVVNITQN